MTVLTIDRKKAVAFFSSFGANTTDLKVKVEKDRMIGKIAFITHYLCKSIPVSDVKDTGYFHISDLDKLCKFLKASKSDNVVLSQLSTTKSLMVSAGSSKVDFPTMSTITSSTRVRLFDDLINKADEGKWQFFSHGPLTVTGTINLSELEAVPKMRGILKNSPVFKLAVDMDDSKMGLSSGKRHEARLFTTVNIKDGDGPSIRQEAYFGPYFMDCIGLLSPTSADFKFGDGCVLVLTQGEDMLIVIDQEK